MDFSNRGPQQPVHPNPQFNAAPQPRVKSVVKKPTALTKWGTLGVGAVVAILLVALIAVVSFSGTKSQADYIYTNKLQAVFLNTGQVYFGNIKSINPQYLVLQNIYYLQTNNSNSSSTTSSSSSNSNVSLVKLGCELHAPYDQMVINMGQVTFWENLQSTGQVAKAVAQYQKQYPNGQQCNNTASVSSQSAPAASSSATPTPTPSPATSTTTPATTKKP